MKNCTTVKLDDGREVCLSYGVPVAAYLPKYPGPHKFVKTDRRYSVTTSRHTNAFIGITRFVHEIDDGAFRRLIAPVVGGSR